jgi:2'-5' RNA ligase
MPRLFTGIELPPDIASRLSLLRGGLAGARWIDEENYHLTLRFIGDVDMVVAEAVAESLAEVERRPFPVHIESVGVLGTRKHRAIVARVAPSPPLMELQAEHERRMQRIGLAPEGRKFTPHVTLARLRDGNANDIAEYLSARGGFFVRPFPVHRFVLFSSRNSVGGGPYVVEEAYDLGWPEPWAEEAERWPAS